MKKIIPMNNALIDVNITGSKFTMKILFAITEKPLITAVKTASNVPRDSLFM